MKYGQGTDPTALWASLQNKGTAWCTKGFATAETQLKGGDFYVYYTYDRQGKPTIPRIAIRMQEGQIAEVRGVADSEQNLEGNMAEIAEAKMNELSGAERYHKASTDMKQLTAIERKVKAGQGLSAQELVFLYEINSPIEGFGYSRDPRIEELRSQRNPQKEDMPIIFGCEKSQIARSPREVRADTKAYVGPLEPGIFDLLSRYNIEHVYTSFPEGKIHRESLEIGGKTAQQLEAELEKAGVNISSYARDMLHSPNFTTLPNSEPLEIVRLTVGDLGFTEIATTEQIYERARQSGLDLCPAEVGPHLRLKDTDQLLGEWYYIGMKQIADSDGHPNVFRLGRGGGGVWLSGGWAGPGGRWRPGHGFVFGLRKSTQNLGFFDRVFRR